MLSSNPLVRTAARLQRWVEMATLHNGADPTDQAGPELRIMRELGRDFLEERIAPATINRLGVRHHLVVKLGVVQRGGKAPQRDVAGQA
jgi:hypothetical protein